MIKGNKRTFEKADPELRQRIEDLQAALDRELPEIQSLAKDIKREWRAARKALLQLREVRKQQGLSLADVSDQSDIGREAICKLENDLEPNPTVRTLARYADALGLELMITFAPKEA